MNIQSQVVIARPVEVVYSYLLDLEHTQEFDPDVRTAKRTTPGAIGPGTEFELYERTPPFGKFAPTSVTYTEVEPNRRISFVARIGPMRPAGSLTFEPADGGTRLTFRGTANPHGLARLFAPLVRRRGRKVWDERLAHVKAQLEH